MASRAEPVAGRLVGGLVFRARGTVRVFATRFVAFVACFFVACFVGAIEEGCSLFGVQANAIPAPHRAGNPLLRGMRGTARAGEPFPGYACGGRVSPPAPARRQQPAPDPRPTLPAPDQPVPGRTGTGDPHRAARTASGPPAAC